MVQLSLLLALLSALGALAQSPADVKDTTGDNLLECSDLTDLSEMSLCLTRKFSEVKKKTSPSNYGYPYRIAPTLPPFLVADPPSNSIGTYQKRTDQDRRHARIQGYSEPQYRNFLDMDTTLRPRVAEYRPVYGDYAVPVLIYPEVNKPKTPKSSYYLKPSTQTTRYPKKAYGQQPGYYNRYNTRPQQEDYKGRTIKHETGYVNKFKNYDRDYYVPANSPIIGDIRRSLMDYTGASDLMEDEPEYVLRSHRIKEMSYDFYPFRRSFLVDLEVNESKAKPSTNSGNRKESN